MLKKQNGMTMVSWMVVAAFCGAMGLVILKLIPVYMDYASVKSIMDDISLDSEIKGKSASMIRALLHRRLDVNALSRMHEKKGAFKFAKKDFGYTLTLDYEERENLIGNFDYVIVFDYEVDLKVK